MRKWIKKILFIMWVLFGVAALTTLIAAMHKKDQSTCKSITIQIKKSNNHTFLNEKEVEQLLARNDSTFIIGKPLQNIDLRALENILLANIWIEKANLFFDNNNTLHVCITERSPIARIFDIWGKSFYIDSSCTQLPLASNINVQLPVFTNFPFNGNKLTIQDTLLLHQIKDISTYILADSFWMAQIQQIDITPQRNFEMIPTVGNQLIVFGDGTNYKDKFRRLKIFYEKAWAKVGIEKYEKLDVQFYRQIVATRKGAGTVGVDTAQAKQLMQNLINDLQKQAIDTSELHTTSTPFINIDSAHIATILDQQPEDSIKINNSITKKPIVSNKKIKHNKQKSITNKTIIQKPKVHL